MKRMRWGSHHVDIYSYSNTLREWILISCHLEGDLNICTAPKGLPRGTKFSSSVKNQSLQLKRKEDCVFYEQSL
jgi:hypothetical protein